MHVRFLFDVIVLEFWSLQLNKTQIKHAQNCNKNLPSSKKIKKKPCWGIIELHLIFLFKGNNNRAPSMFLPCMHANVDSHLSLDELVTSFKLSVCLSVSLCFISHSIDFLTRQKTSNFVTSNVCILIISIKYRLIIKLITGREIARRIY
jgi:hypothetical protein